MTASLSRFFSRLVRLRALPYKTDMVFSDAAQDAMTPPDPVERHLAEGERARRLFFQEAAPLVRRAALGLALGLAAGGKLLLCGSGGGSLLARQMLALLTGRFDLDRPALPAAVLLPEDAAPPQTARSAFVACPLVRQIEALGAAGDGLIIFSPSGHDAALAAAAEAAQQRQMRVVALAGEHGEALAAHSDILLRTPHAPRPLVQELHMAAGHLVCRLIDYYLFENPAALRAAAATA